MPLLSILCPLPRSSTNDKSIRIFLEPPSSIPNVPAYLQSEANRIGD
jgi:hypothetical protein